MSQTRNTKAVLSWIFSYLSPYRGKVIGACIALLIASGTWLALGQGIRIFIDRGFGSGDASQLGPLVGLIMTIVFVGCIATFVRFYLMTWLGERVSADIRVSVFDRLLQLSPEYFQQQRTGEILSRFTADATLLQTVVGMSLSMTLRSAITAIGGITMMLVTSPSLAGLVLITVPLVLIPISVFGKKVKSLAKASQDKVADLGAYLDETLHEIHTVQSYTHESIDQRQFGDHTRAVMKAAQQRIWYRSLLIAVVMLLSLGAITSITWYGAVQVFDGSISAGELTAFIFYAVMVASAVATISEVLGEVLRAAGASERLMELQQAHDVIADHDGQEQLKLDDRADIQLEQVSFSYPSEPDKAVIDNLSLTIQPGERVALVGQSGAGKSTLFQLLLHFYLPQQGRVLLGGQDIKTMSNESIRRQFAIVPQESVIFANSVFENVRYGRPQASEEEVIAACVAANADEFIQGLGEGYHTQLGERGARLSGGQKQRIAIARAILSQRPFLLLDEATSALDALSEQKVQQALENLMQGRTSIIIAHRLATVRNADRILYMEAGRIQASGTHEQLLEQSDAYRQLAELQLLT